MSHELVGHVPGNEYQPAHRCEPSDDGPTIQSRTSSVQFNPGDLVRCTTCGQLWFCSGCSDSGGTLYWRRATWWDRRVARRRARRARRDINQKVRDLA